MKKFNFKLQKIQRMRVAAEREALVELSRTVGAVREAEEHLRMIQERRVEVMASLRGTMDEAVVQVPVLERHHKDLDRLDGFEARGRQSLAAAQSAYDAAAEWLRERRGEVKALELLEEKERRRHQEECNREEGALQDELALARHDRRVR